MKAFIHVLKGIALMLTRIVMGLIMVTHGWHRWQNEGITAEATILEQAGIPNPGLMVWLLIGFEVIGGIFLIFGLADQHAGEAQNIGHRQLAQAVELLAPFFV